MVTTDVIVTRNNCNRQSFVLAFLSCNYDYGGHAARALLAWNNAHARFCRDVPAAKRRESHPQNYDYGGAASPLCGFAACVFPVFPSSLVNMVTTDVIGTRNNCNRRSFVLAFLSWNYDYGGQESHKCMCLHKLGFIGLLRTLS